MYSVEDSIRTTINIININLKQSGQLDTHAFDLVNFIADLSLTNTALDMCKHMGYESITKKQLSGAVKGHLCTPTSPEIAKRYNDYLFLIIIETGPMSLIYGAKTQSGALKFCKDIGYPIFKLG